MNASIMSLLKDAKITVMNDAVTAGTTAVTPTSPVDMTGFETVVFLALTGDVTSGSVLTLTANEVASDTNSGGTAITGGAATFTAGATSADVKCLATEYVRPKLRYVYPTLTRTTQNAVINGIIAIQLGASATPVTQSASVIATGFAAGN